MRITVVLPAYNRPALLADTLHSVLAQTRPADEIIVVDDGSKEDLCGRVATIDPAIRCVRQENGGQGAARLHGTRLATGDAICYLDSDDLLLPDALNLLERALEANPDHAAVVGACELVRPDSSPLGPCPLNAARLCGADLWERFIVGNLIRTPGCVLVRRDSVLRAGDWDPDRALRGNEDWDLWLRLLNRGNYIQIPDTVLQYRVHDESTSANAARMRLATLRIYEKHLRLEKNNPVRRRVVAELLNWTSIQSFETVMQARKSGSGLSGAALGAFLWRVALFLPTVAKTNLRVRLGAARQRMSHS